MNNLSWALYYIGILPSLDGFFTFLGVVFAIGTILSGIAFGISSAEAADPQWQARRESNLRWASVSYKLMCTFPFLVILFGVGAALIPDITTLHLILASELGESTIKNPEVIEIFDLLKNNLKEYLKKG